MTPCLDCGRLIPKGSKHSRCERCAAPIVAREKAAHAFKYGAGGVRRAMKEAVQRAGNRCQGCGAPNTPENPLHAHLPGGGPHPADWRAYLVLCQRICHPQAERTERAARRAGVTDNLPPAA